MTVSYTYDFDGIKVSMNDGSKTKNYLIDKIQPYAQVIAEYDNNNNLNVEYVFGLERIKQDRSGFVSFYLADGQGSIRQLANISGNVTDTYDYYAFGEELSRTGTTKNEFKYVGEQFDPNSNFYYLRARWMSPETGRFVSVDPFVGDPMSPLSLHRYLYANQSPISFYDPSGEFTLVGLFNALGAQQSLLMLAIPKIIFSGFRIMTTINMSKRLFEPASEIISRSIYYIDINIDAVDIYCKARLVYSIGLRIYGSMHQAFSFGESLTYIAADAIELIDKMSLASTLLIMTDFQPFLRDTRDFFKDIEELGKEIQNK